MAQLQIRRVERKAHATVIRVGKSDIEIQAADDATLRAWAELRVPSKEEAALAIALLEHFNAGRSADSLHLISGRTVDVIVRKLQQERGE